jgi:AcrR family transcriptional regulator
MKNQESTSEKRFPGLRERKKADLKRRIAETAIALIRERGYENTTIDEIVRRVDVSQPTFYNYYPNKDAILRDWAVLGFASLLSNEIPTTETISGRIRRFLQAVAEQMTADRDLWYAIAVSNAYNPIRDPDLLASNESTTRVLEAVIEEGQRAGEFTSVYSAQRLASLFEGVMFRVCLEWGAGFPDTRPLSEGLDEGFDLFLRAACPRPGDPDYSPTASASKRKATPARRPRDHAVTPKPASRKRR